MPQLHPKETASKKHTGTLVDQKQHEAFNKPGPINEKIKSVPIHLPKPEDIFITLGKWDHIIIFDMYNGYFQNHMCKKDIPWLGIQT